MGAREPDHWSEYFCKFIKLKCAIIHYAFIAELSQLTGTAKMTSTLSISPGHKYV